MKYKHFILLALIATFGSVPIQASNTSQDTTICEYPEQLAVFPGDLHAYLAQRIRYPALCKAAGIQGRVTVAFIVNQDGSISNKEIKRSPCNDLSQETLRILENMPLWKPAMYKGQAVRMRYVIPVMFRLKPLPEENLTEQEARSALETIYADVINKGKLWSEDRKASEKIDLVKRHATKAFRKEYERIQDWEEKYLDEIGFWDADFWTNSQEFWSKATITRVELQGDGSCIGYVFLQDILNSKGQDNIVALRLVREKKTWKMDDIITQGSLRKDMEAYILENKIK